MKADRVEQLKGVFLGNALLFFVYSILFILLQFLHFETTNVTLHFLPPYLHFTSMSAFIHSLKEKLSQRHVIAVILVFIGISGIRFYWMNQKVAFHEDEVYSVSIVTQNEYGLWSGKDFNQNQAYTGKQIKEAIFFDDASFKDTLRDLGHLWIYNRDTAYNNLYIYLSRIWFTGLKTADFKTIFIRASLLNYVFFCIAFYFLYLILAQITNNKLTRILILLASFLNPASIGLSVFMRSYALQETILILFAYVFVFYFKSISDHKKVMSFQNFIRTSIVAMLVFSIDYFSMLFLGIMGLILIFVSIKEKNGEMVLYLFCAVFLGLLFTKCLYLNYGTGFFSGRGAEAFSSATEGAHSLETLFLTNTFITKNLLPFVLLLIVAGASCILNYITDKCILPLHIILFSTAVVFIYVVLYITPVIAFRYVAAIFVLLPLCMIFSKNKGWLSYICNAVQGILVALIISNVMPMPENFTKIEHLNDSKEQYVSSNFFKDTSTPVVIHSRADYPNILPYLHDEQIVYFAKSLEQAKTYPIKNDTFWYVDVINKDGSLVLTEELIIKEGQL
ncbi:MAG: hypothetical protein IJP62_00100 [Treponema sp.]|nr:hypothetical protein [Treponema sp.]